MKLICEIMTEEPEGGSAMIPLETFLDLYEFLAKIDASQPRKLQNMHFSDSLLDLMTKSSDKQDQPKIIQEEFVYEEESMKSQTTEKSESEETEKEITKEEISCPSFVEGDAVDPYAMDFYIREVGAEAEAEAEDNEGEMYTDYQRPLDFEMEGEDPDVQDGDLYQVMESKDVRESASEESAGQAIAADTEIKETATATTKEQPTEVVKTKDDDERNSLDAVLDDAPYESVDTIQEIPRKIVPDEIDEEKRLLEDLQRLQAMQQEIVGETDEEVEKFKCKLIEQMPLSASQEVAIEQFKDVEVPEEPEEVVEKETSKDIQNEEKKPDIDEVFLDAIPGIGGVVPDTVVKAVCDYMKSVSAIQHGMVMPRNIRHYNCPPLEILDYGI